MKILINIDGYLFCRDGSIDRFRRAVPGDILEVSTDRNTIQILVQEANNGEICCPCALDEYPGLCTNARCNQFVYSNLDTVLEDL